MAGRKRDWKFICAVIFWTMFISSPIVYTIYERSEKRESVEFYTIGTITGKKVVGKDRGATFEYVVNGEKRQSFCGNQQCTDAEVGSRYIVKYWDQHPDWFEILFDNPVPNGVTAPLDGWREVPKF